MAGLLSTYFGDTAMDPQMASKIIDFSRFSLSELVQCSRHAYRRAVRPLWVLPTSRVPKIAQKSKKGRKKSPQFFLYVRFGKDFVNK